MCVERITRFLFTLVTLCTACVLKSEQLLLTALGASALFAELLLSVTIILTTHKLRILLPSADKTPLLALFRFYYSINLAHTLIQLPLPVCDNCIS